MNQRVLLRGARKRREGNPEVFGAAAIPSGYTVTCPVPTRPLACVLLAYLKDQGVGIAIMGRREVAFGLPRYALSRLSLPDDRVQAIVQTARASGEGGAFECEVDIELTEAIPEWREHRDSDQG